MRSIAALLLTVSLLSCAGSLPATSTFYVLNGALARTLYQPLLVGQSVTVTITEKQCTATTNPSTFPQPYYQSCVILTIPPNIQSKVLNGPCPLTVTTLPYPDNFLLFRTGPGSPNIIYNNVSGWCEVQFFDPATSAFVNIFV